MKLGICCIAKNENLYINDWAEYHINLGFTDIYIYDNNDNDTNLLSVFNKKIQDKIHIIPSYNLPQYQLKAYNDFFQKYANKFDWVAVIDCDEFITFENNMSLEKYLEKMKSNDIIKLTWKTFGDDGKIKDDTSIPVYKRFFKEFKGTIYKGCGIMIKCLMNCQRNQKYVWHSCHTPDSDNFKMCLSNGEQTNIVTHNEKFIGNVYIRHYMTKSLDEFINQKFNRSNARFRINTGLGYYFKINKRTQEKENYLKSLGIDI